MNIIDLLRISDQFILKKKLKMLQLQLQSYYEQ